VVGDLAPGEAADLDPGGVEVGATPPVALECRVAAVGGVAVDLHDEALIGPGSAPRPLAQALQIPIGEEIAEPGLVQRPPDARGVRGRCEVEDRLGRRRGGR
jgi:hypothetical protein